MISKVEQDYCIQKLSNGEKIRHYYGNLALDGKFIRLPMHEETGAIETLYLSGGKDAYSKMIAEVFAKVATT